MESITGIVAFFNKCDKSQKEMHSMLEPLRGNSVEKIFIDFDPVEFNTDEKDTLADVSDEKLYSMANPMLSCTIELEPTSLSKTTKTEIKLESSSDSANEDHFDDIGDSFSHRYDFSSSDDEFLVKKIVVRESDEEQEDMLCNICGDIFKKKVWKNCDLLIF